MTIHTTYQKEVYDRISEIIESARHGEESFFTDSRKATTDIVDYLEQERILHFPKETTIVNY